MNDHYKYELGSRVTIKHELTLYGTDDETGEDLKLIIPSGQQGEINSCGRDSRYRYQEIYYVSFVIDGSDVEAMFFLQDLENACLLESPVDTE